MSQADFGLNIHVIRFSLPHDAIKDNDDCRVSVTTIPEKNKQAFIIKGQYMSNVHKFFTLNITPNTSKILFVFRKKRKLLDDQIVASTILYSKDFPTTISKSSDVNSSNEKTIPIFEPVQGENYNGHSYGFQSKRRTIGQLQISLLLTQSFPDIKYESAEMSSNVHTFDHGSYGNTSSYGSCGNTSSYGSSGNNRSYASYGNTSPYGSYGNTNPYGSYGNTNPYDSYGNTSEKAQNYNENQETNYMKDFSTYFYDQQHDNEHANETQQQPQQQYGNQQQAYQQYGNQQQAYQQYGNQQQAYQQYGNQQQAHQQYGNQQQAYQQYGNQQPQQQYGNQQQAYQQYANQFQGNQQQIPVYQNSQFTQQYQNSTEPNLIEF